MKNYLTEREGQLDFFETYSINFENNYGEEILKDSTDGIFRGSLFEFKLNISDLNKVLFQAIKYLSKERIKGHNVPASIFLVDLNKNIVYEYKSKDYYKEIHEIYSGGASKEICGFIGKTPSFTFFLENLEDKTKFIDHLGKNKDFLKIDIDENCIVGWAERYYRENPQSTKDDFLKDDGELRKPDKFKDYINPYIGESNEKFKYLMDKLNDKFKKKKLGAFYTPILYAQKAKELVDIAISKIPKGWSYIILDRCAGTGNLESQLSDEQLSHCILSTYEYYEWLVLKERLEDKVLKILPEKETFKDGFVKENDAMSREYIENKFLKEYIEKENCVIIILENPPYSEVGSNLNTDNISGNDNSFVLSEMKKDKNFGRLTNEISNRFIWSAYKYYQRNEYDSMILFSPSKYWKVTDLLVNKEFKKGYILNRKYFHATPGHILLALWQNKNSSITELKDIEILDIEDETIKSCGNLTIKRCKDMLSRLYDKRTFSDDITRNKDNNKNEVIWCEKDGYEATNKNIRCPSTYNKNIIGIIETDSFYSNQISCKLLRQRVYNGSDSYLRKDIYLEKLVLFTTKISYAYRTNWWEDYICTTSDLSNKYASDFEFLKYSLIYASLSPFNKCLSFKGSNKVDYFNELCFDKKSPHKSQALIDLESMTLDNDGNQRPLHKDATDSIVKTNEDGTKELKFKPLTLNAEEVELLKIWDTIMDLASQTKNYNKDYSYGLYQIIQELNTFVKTKDGNQYDYPLLNGNINTLKTKLKEYYKKYIEPKCFEYELLK